MTYLDLTLPLPIPPWHTLTFLASLLCVSPPPRSPVGVAQIPLAVEPAVDFGWPMSGHNLKENGLFLSQ